MNLKRWVRGLVRRRPEPGFAEEVVFRQSLAGLVRHNGRMRRVGCRCHRTPDPHADVISAGARAPGECPYLRLPWMTIANVRLPCAGNPAWQNLDVRGDGRWKDLPPTLIGWAQLRRSFGEKRKPPRAAKDYR